MDKVTIRSFVEELSQLPIVSEYHEVRDGDEHIRK